MTTIGVITHGMKAGMVVLLPLPAVDGVLPLKLTLRARSPRRRSSVRPM